MWVLGQQLQVLCNQVRYARRLAFELIDLLSLGVFMKTQLCMGFCMMVHTVSRVGMSVSMLSPFTLFTISTMHPSGS